MEGERQVADAAVRVFARLVENYGEQRAWQILAGMRDDCGFADRVRAAWKRSQAPDGSARCWCCGARCAEGTPCPGVVIAADTIVAKWRVGGGLL